MTQKDIELMLELRKSRKDHMYTAIQGTYHVQGYAPDGDSIRFQATNPAQWDRFKWESAEKKKSPRKQLRLEGIDALETHYEGRHQPRAFALAALEHLLGTLGITGIRYNLLCTAIAQAVDGTPGTIIVRELDRYDRPVCFAFPGTAGFKDGAVIPAQKLVLKRSANWLMADAGLAYGTFYSTQDETTRATLRRVVELARKDRRGLWALDRSTEGFDLLGPASVEDDHVIMPKLFRRLIDFMSRTDDIATLAAWLAKQEEPVFVLAADGTSTKTKFGKLIAIEGKRLRLLAKPEQLIFDV